MTDLNSTYIEPGANAYDRINLEEDLTLDGGNQIREELEPGGPLENRNLPVTITGSVDTSTPGTYIITYTATDNQNNSSSKTRSVIVENNQNPIITLAGNNPFLLSQGNNYIEPGVSAVDALGNILQVTSTNNINNNVLGIYTVTYLATDSYGNSATAIRTVNVTDDDGPTITLNGSNPMIIELALYMLNPEQQQLIIMMVILT